MTIGYAVLDDEGNILVRTVSPTALGAKVNWLVRERGAFILDSAPEDFRRRGLGKRLPQHAH